MVLMRNSFFKNNLLLNFLKKHKNNIEKSKYTLHQMFTLFLLSILSITCLYLFTFYGASSLVDRWHYQPNKISQRYVDGSYSTREDYHYDFIAFTSSVIPGYRFKGGNTESLGFGDHKLELVFDDLFKEVNEFLDITIEKNQLEYDFLIQKNIYTHNQYSQLPQNAEQEKDRLGEIHPLTYLSVFITLEESIVLETYHEIEQDSTDIEFEWVGIDGDEDTVATGFIPDVRGSELPFDRGPSYESYPLFNLMDHMLQSNQEKSLSWAEIYERHHKSRLRYLADRPEFIEIFDLKSEDFEKQLEFLDQNGSRVFGFLVSGEAYDVRDVLVDFPATVRHIEVKGALPLKP